MVILQLSQQQYERLVKSLAASAHAEPLEASYTVRLNINGADGVRRQAATGIPQQGGGFAGAARLPRRMSPPV